MLKETLLNNNLTKLQEILTSRIRVRESSTTPAETAQ
ncbi:MAG: hypothetical protein mread185_000248 [Mycoplasmataceae bacterium]|nr:MAG: hypothetical protein mread185_000248 [Mycoplasmataceae bacterium]